MHLILQAIGAATKQGAINVHACVEDVTVLEGNVAIILATIEPKGELVCWKFFEETGLQHGVYGDAAMESWIERTKDFTNFCRKGPEIDLSLEDKAEAVGYVIAKRLGLKRKKNGRYDVWGGDKTDVGLARTMLHWIKELLEPSSKSLGNKMCVAEVERQNDFVSGVAR